MYDIRTKHVRNRIISENDIQARLYTISQDLSVNPLLFKSMPLLFPSPYVIYLTSSAPPPCPDRRIHVTDEAT